jgi:PIN domain nuclease of toxin-antitoxin system
MNLFDASALLAFLQGEAGSDVVETKLVEGGVCGAANWSEVAQKVRSSGRDWELARALLSSYGLGVEPVTEADAELAAELWTRGSGRSLGDRLCLALGRRLDATVWTADTEWGSDGPVQQIR